MRDHSIRLVIINVDQSSREMANPKMADQSDH